MDFVNKIGFISKIGIADKIGTINFDKINLVDGIIEWTFLLILFTKTLQFNC